MRGARIRCHRGKKRKGKKRKGKKRKGKKRKGKKRKRKKRKGKKRKGKKRKEKRGLTRRRGGRGESGEEKGVVPLFILKTAVDIAATFIFFSVFLEPFRSNQGAAGQGRRGEIYYEACRV